MTFFVLKFSKSEYEQPVQINKFDLLLLFFLSNLFELFPHLKSEPSAYLFSVVSMEMRT